MRLSISNVLLLVLAICVGLGWYVDRQRSNDARIAIETEREELWRQLRERTQVAQTYKSSIARRQSTAIELGVFKELSEVRSVEIDVFLDCHRRHIRSRRRMRN